MQPDITVVVPVYNEEDSIGKLYSELNAALEALNRPYEVIITDDGSKDNSFARLKEIHEKDPRWQIIQFRRNFGQTAAMQAGFDHARGKIVITIDADLQNDPADIPRLLEKMETEDYDIVSGWRVNRKEPLISRRLPSMMANGLISRTTGVHLHDYGCSLKAYRREVVKNVQLYQGLHRFIPAMASHMGVRVAEIGVNDRPREFGASKYGIWRTFRVFLDVIAVFFLLNYSQRPIYIFGGIGLGFSLFGTLIGIYLTLLKLITGADIGSRPLLFLSGLLIIVGVQMLSMGLLAEMQVRTYYESRGATAYFIRNELITNSDDLETAS